MNLCDLFGCDFSPDDGIGSLGCECVHCGRTVRESLQRTPIRRGIRFTILVLALAWVAWRFA